MNIILVVASRLSRLWHKFYHPITIGTRAIILNEQKDAVLLVKMSYTSEWYLPGGKLKRGEMIVDGLKRELSEELGFTADENKVELFGIYNNFYEGKSDTIIVFTCSGTISKSHKNIEVERYQFFHFDKLPESISPGTKRRIHEYFGNQPTHVGKW